MVPHRAYAFALMFSLAIADVKSTSIVTFDVTGDGFHREAHCEVALERARRESGTTRSARAFAFAFAFERDLVVDRDKVLTANANGDRKTTHGDDDVRCDVTGDVDVERASWSAKPSVATCENEANETSSAVPHTMRASVAFDVRYPEPRKGGGRKIIVLEPCEVTIRYANGDVARARAGEAAVVSVPVGDLDDAMTVRCVTSVSDVLASLVVVAVAVARARGRRRSGGDDDDDGDRARRSRASEKFLGWRNS